MLPFLVVQLAKLASERQIEAVIVGIAAFITFAVIDGISQTVDGVLAVRQSHGLACVIDPVGGEADARRDIVVGDDNEVVRPVVRRAVFLIKIDSLDGAESPGIGVGNPS